MPNRSVEVCNLFRYFGSYDMGGDFLGVRIIVDIHTYSGKKGEKGDVQNGSDRPTDRFHAYGPIWGIRTMGNLCGFPHGRAG